MPTSKPKPCRSTAATMTGRALTEILEPWVGMTAEPKVGLCAYRCDGSGCVHMLACTCLRVHAVKTEPEAGLCAYRCDGSGCVHMLTCTRCEESTYNTTCNVTFYYTYSAHTHTHALYRTQ